MPVHNYTKRRFTSFTSFAGKYSKGFNGTKTKRLLASFLSLDVIVFIQTMAVLKQIPLQPPQYLNYSLDKT